MLSACHMLMHQQHVAPQHPAKIVWTSQTFHSIGNRPSPIMAHSLWGDRKQRLQSSQTGSDIPIHQIALSATSAEVTSDWVSYVELPHTPPMGLHLLGYQWHSSATSHDPRDNQSVGFCRKLLADGTNFAEHRCSIPTWPGHLASENARVSSS